ncbi:tRNA (adenosine(37)-N6)-threonylcarbamoyltransferase complex dimerization subunit type 1 TsaB [Angustibacter sp. McL0619]|uniref:tRNA (adenosine(37)-N6)-threonylcarbamoyltransferase complex dimerization subunit type 1 TsaB n=1 Tax=Angustibacter sp. McL0619 TaxID=3415676 RepID=UPI003CEC5BFA
MLLLALDTSTPAVTVALHDGDTVVAQSLSVDARRHGELLAPGIQAVLSEAGACARDLTDVAVGTGPGPFTGLRVGLVTARTMGDALGVPVHGVCSLDALAVRAAEDGAVGDDPFLVATDARRREVYWAAYESVPDGAVGTTPRRVHGPDVSRPDDVPVDGRAVVGRGADLYPDSLGISVGPIDPSAAALAGLVVRLLDAGADLSDLTPRYLRRPDVHEGGGRKSVLS